MQAHVEKTAKLTQASRAENVTHRFHDIVLQIILQGSVMWRHSMVLRPHYRTSHSLSENLKRKIDEEKRKFNLPPKKINIKRA